MPILILALWIEIEVIFKNSYPLFYFHSGNTKLSMKLINLIITAVLDPSLFFSWFPFFESDKQAIDIKFNNRKGGVV